MNTPLSNWFAHVLAWLFGPTNIPIWSWVAVPALGVIFMTALFGLNDVQVRDFRHIHRRSGLIELVLGVSFLATAWSSFLIMASCLLGANIYSWRGALLSWGIAGIFGLVGNFAPWRYWLKRVVDGDLVSASIPP